LSYLKTKPYLAQVLFWPFAAFVLRMKYRVYKNSDKRAMCLVVPKFGPLGKGQKKKLARKLLSEGN